MTIRSSTRWIGAIRSAAEVRVDARRPVNAAGRDCQQQRLQDQAGGVLFAVAIQAWAEAVRNPAILSTAHRFYTELVHDLAAVLDRWASDGHRLAGESEQLARMMAGVLQGYIIQVTSFGVDADPDYLAGLCTRVTAMVSH